MEIHKKPVFKVSEIPTSINGVKLSEKDMDHLMYGESSGLLKNMIFDDEQRDGKVWLSRDETGELEVNYLFSKQDTSLSKQMDDYLIPEKDKKRLMNLQTVGPFLFGRQSVFLQIDPDLNRIVVKSGYEMNVPKRIAGYSLTAEDMNALANGEKMKNRLFFVEGKYFSAEIVKKADQRGLFFDNCIDQNNLSKEQLQHLEGLLNTSVIPPLPSLELAPGLEKKRVSRKKEFARYTINTDGATVPVQSEISEQQKLFRDAVDNYDMNTLAQLKKSGFTPDVSDIEHIKNNINLDRVDKIIIAMVLEINHTEVTYDEHNRPDHVWHTQSLNRQDRETDTLNIQQPQQTENTEKNHFQTQEASEGKKQREKDSEKSSDAVTAQKFGNVITEAFNNM